MGLAMRARRQRRRMRPTGRSPARKPPACAPQAEREAALEARIAELEDALRARDDFLAIAAHELRNPMTPIGAQIELLLAKARRQPETVPAGTVQGLERLERSVDAYVRRATTLLEVSRIDSGSLDLKAAEVDLSALVRKVATGMIPAARRAGCRVRLRVPEGITGTCDATAVEQILENLLSNAVRYGAGRPVEVALAGDGATVRLSVRDEGIGISASDQARLFERFRRLGRKSADGGFGMGLWIARRLVEAMRGEIAVASAAGAGATFTVTLPLSPQDEADGR
jgi:two-component system OmpR family sensor kinase